MKVICVNSDWKFDNRKNKTGPSFGEVCEVAESDYTPDGTLFHYLEGYPRWYEAIAFIPLSEIDEREMSREYSLPAELLQVSPN